jgi:group II intron reverse transcriptase/maturase
LERIRKAARKDKAARFTALWHHVCDVNLLREEYFALKRQSAPGVDGQTWSQYGQNLEANLHDLSSRLHRGAYHAKPVKRVYIPKPDGRQRPIGIPTLEDKIVQRAAAKVMSSVYETDFMGFSYGFRPGRRAHEALDALAVGISRRKVGWVLDADIRGFFDTIDHEWLVKFVEHRIADPRMIRHIKKWLNAGVMEDGKRTQAEEGTPQGGSISPLLANIYLHYALDLWANHWRKTQARGEVIIVRYADDFVVGFEHRDDGQRFLEGLRERFRRFGLELHPDKTRLIEFGRYASERRERRGLGKPETFNFLGFTHSCGKSRTNRGFLVLRRPMKKRMQAKLKAIREELRRRWHAPVPEVGAWLKSVLVGWYRYYAVPLTSKDLSSFRHQVRWLWRRALSRRSQRSRMTWERMDRLVAQWLPIPRILHPYPSERIHA